MTQKYHFFIGLSLFLSGMAAEGKIESIFKLNNCKQNIEK